MTLANQIQQPEGRRLEFKEELPANAELAKAIIAFANDAGGEWKEPGIAFRVSFIKKDYVEQPELQPELQPLTMYGEILFMLNEKELSKKDLSVEFYQKAISGHLNQTINKLVKDGLVERTEEKLKSSKQKYRLTRKGHEFYKLVNQED